ncbi:hypothetical protein CRH09_20825 [Nocardia terpenica]|uniref:Uncharacterized protein n=1 Tax=Nocardia terpenica TaxID=455432 RepID=A0A291RL21_9NOCA|nr:hypothetical protein CRH09_20825 [Nocardia terpenica]
MGVVRIQEMQSVGDGGIDVEVVGPPGGGSDEEAEGAGRYLFIVSMWSGRGTKVSGPVGSVHTDREPSWRLRAGRM